MDYKKIEEKWQKAWADAKIFEVEPNDKKPLLITAAFPYVNSPQHIGHLRTYGTADTYARYKRMRGFNVLYPMAFHASGIPLVAFSKRLKNKDQSLIDEFKIFHVPEGEISKMVDPKYLADYFIKETEFGMRRAGYGIDWRRKFVSIDPLFSKFIEWQFKNLIEKGHIVKGKHPIGWCTNENNAVGQHDTKHDVHPEIELLTAVKFKDAESDAYFACTTYRPETLYGVTNIFVNESVDYVVAKVNGERFYLSKDAADMLKYQLDVSVEGPISGKALLAKKAINPINNAVIPVLPGFFVKPDIGTGVVMSVPAHAPFDYVALQRLKKQNYPMPEMEYKTVLEIEKNNGIGIGRTLTDVTTGAVKPLHPEMPALAYLEILNTNEDAIDDMVEFATKLQYREESHWGVMTIENYKGMKEPEARDKIKEKLLKEGSAIGMYIISNDEPVYCRCGYRVIVKVVDDQWFINYGDPKWKDIVKQRLEKMRIYPEKYRLTFNNVIDWLDLRAVEREQGLGTPFPLNKSHIIESLSDSTIYMSFYTFVHILRDEKITPDQLKPEFFEYVIMSAMDAEAAEKATGVSSTILDKCKESFQYWYSNTSRHSGPDLVPNHLTMYIFNHVALLKEENWPNQIVVNGLVNYEGEKMSKSLGNIVPIVDGIEKYGSDPLRFIEMTGADLDTETEFSIDSVNSVQSRNDYLFRAIESLSDVKSKELSHIDYWLYSKLNSKIKNATQFMESINLKNAYTEIYYNSINELKKYIERGGSNDIVMREYIEDIVLMLAPAMPHIAEEYWSTLGKTTMVVKEKWPETDEQLINPDEEIVEEIIDNTIEDVRQGVELTKRIGSNKDKQVKEIKLIISAPWKVKAYSILAKTKNIGAVMSDPELKEIDRSVLSQFLAQFAKKLNSLAERKELDTELLMKAFIEARDYLSGKFGSPIVVESEVTSKSARASRALPDRPSIDITWG